MSFITRMGTTFSENKNQNKSYIAFFDLDKTLIRANSGVILLRVAYRKNLISVTDILKALWLSFLFRFNLRDTEKIISSMVRWLSGIPERELNELVSEAFEKHLAELVPARAKSEIMLHKNKNALVVILSSALQPVCKCIADHIGMDDIICTELESVEGKFTGLPSGKLCFGNEKKIRLMEYCEKINRHKEDAWFYSDSIDDLPALNVAGHPVCVNPGRRLKNHAVKKEWKIVIW